MYNCNENREQVQCNTLVMLYSIVYALLDFTVFYWSCLFVCKFELKDERQQRVKSRHECTVFNSANENRRNVHVSFSYLEQQTAEG